MKPTTVKFTLLTLAAAVGIGAGALQVASVGERMTTAGQTFVNTLTPEQKKVALKPFDDAKRTDWHYIPKPERKGLQVKDMTDEQRTAAHALLRACLSQVGYNKATTIMQQEEILKELEKSKKGGAIRSSVRYFFTVFGDVSPTGKWGLSVEGHHFSQNFVVDSGKLVSFTPCFFGSNPHVIKTDVPGAPKVGTEVLADEENTGFALLNSLDEAQKKTAIIDAKPSKDIRGGGEAQAPIDGPRGIEASALNPEQKKLLTAIIETYLGNIPADVAAAARGEIEQSGLDKLTFAWAGATTKGIGHFYKVQGPTFIIEYCNVQPDSAGNVANHSHAVWRDVRGDFAIHR
jgi:hypothetical protein